MDNAQFSKTGGTWTNRVQMMVGGEPAWVTVPIVRAYHGVRTIREMRITADAGWRLKVLRTIEQNYRRAPFFKEVYPLVGGALSNPTVELLEYNLSPIRAICAGLGLQTPIVLGSSLGADGRATDLLISMVKAVGGTSYLAGGGASGYQEDHKFPEAGLELIQQEFQHPIYPQLGSSTFRPGLSIVDALMNCGFERTADLLGRSA